jgi:hypothetical protein
VDTDQNILFASPPILIGILVRSFARVHISFFEPLAHVFGAAGTEIC